MAYWFIMNSQLSPGDDLKQLFQSSIPTFIKKELN